MKIILACLLWFSLGLMFSFSITYEPQPKYDWVIVSEVGTVFTLKSARGIKSVDPHIVDDEQWLQIEWEGR